MVMNLFTATNLIHSKCRFQVVSPCKMSRKVHCQQIRMATSFAGIYQCSLDRGGAGSQWLFWLSVVVLGSQWLCW